MKITPEQRAEIKMSLVLYVDYAGWQETGYLRFCPLSTSTFPHGLSIGVRVAVGALEDLEAAKNKVADFFVDAFEHLL